VLTVSVGVTSGVAALTTAVAPLQRFILPLSLAAIGLIAWANLAVVRESGRIFAVPTYLFVGSCALMLLVGLGRQSTGHLPPIPDGQTAPLPPQTATVGVLLVLHAFASGCTALTGVEAIFNGVPAFRRPSPERPADPDRHGRHPRDPGRGAQHDQARECGTGPAVGHAANYLRSWRWLITWMTLSPVFAASFPSLKKPLSCCAVALNRPIGVRPDQGGTGHGNLQRRR
jgi:hypothetical protein